MKQKTRHIEREFIQNATKKYKNMEKMKEKLDTKNKKALYLIGVLKRE